VGDARRVGGGCDQCSAMSKARPIKKTARGMRKWLSVRMARALVDVFMGGCRFLLEGCASAKTIIGERGGCL
jgi:hypothetical protein